MGVEVRPLNVACNIQCLYCYQHPQRDAANVTAKYDLIKIKSAVEVENKPFTLFGGEALLMPIEDLEDLWAWGFDRFGHNSIQTNGTLITDAHVALFIRYGVSVGISIDGPGSMNDVRWNGSLERTRASTAKTENAISKLCECGLSIGLIVTLHKGNATADKLPHLGSWLQGLARIGVKSIRLHLLESESEEIRNRFSLGVPGNIQALTYISTLNDLGRMRVDLFDDMRQLLQGDDRRAGCIWTGCDPYTTQAVRGIEGQGRQSNCGRTNKDGIDFTKSAVTGYERYLSLYYTPQDHGGCNGCRFFLMCKGQCPGTAQGGDWRFRSEHCEIWKDLFVTLEAELTERGVSALSLEPRRIEIEKAAINKWSQGEHFSLYAESTTLKSVS